MPQQFYLPLRMVPFQRPRFDGRSGNVFNSHKYSSFKKEVRSHILIKKTNLVPLVGPISIHCTFYFPTPKKLKHQYPIARPDADNLFKCIADCGNELLWADDSQLVEITIHKRYARTHGVYFEFEELFE